MAPLPLPSPSSAPLFSAASLPLPSVHLSRRAQKRARTRFRSPAVVAASVAAGFMALVAVATVMEVGRRSSASPPSMVSYHSPADARSALHPRSALQSSVGALPPPPLLARAAARRLAEAKECASATCPKPSHLSSCGCGCPAVLWEPLVVPIRECAPNGTSALNGSRANATLAGSVVVDGDATVGLVAGNLSRVNSTLLYRTMFTQWDIFDVDQKRVGAIALHLMCIFYAFSGYAIVREQFLEPSLAMLSENLGVAPDMIPIIMAAGASAPKLAISVIGTFGTNNDLGIGTVIGSAMFNVLVIISACAFVSKPVSLSWWPLSRDAVFYNFAIVLMTVFIFDGNVNWFESAMLILLYCLYVVMMRYNERISKAVEKQIANSGKPRGGVVEALKIFIDSKIFTAIIYLAIVANVTCIIYEYVLGQCGGVAGDCQGPDKLTWCGLQTKNGLVNTCCDTKALLDNLNHIFNVLFIVEMIIKHIALSLFGYWRDPLNAFDGVLVLLVVTEYILASDAASGLKSLRMFRFFRALRALRILRFAKLLDKKEAKSKRMSLSMEAHSMPAKTTRGGLRMSLRRNSALPMRKRRLSSIIPAGNAASAVAELQNELESKEGKAEEVAAAVTPAADVGDEVDEPFSPMEKPDGCCGCFWWFLTLPLSLLIWVTVPDCRRPKFQNLHILTLIISVLWIFGLAFMMAWMASEISTSLVIPPQIVGITLLAIGISVPDLLSSMSLARQGFADIAISSFIGNNIFDLLIALPLPWFVYAAVWSPANKYCTHFVETQSKYLNIEILLIFVVISAFMIGLLFSGWKLTKKLGAGLIAWYCVYMSFVILSEVGIISL